MSTSGIRISNEHVALFIARLRERVYRFLYGPTTTTGSSSSSPNPILPTYLTPLSWILTLQISAISFIWFISTIPLRLSLDVYERHVRAMFPRLPSIRQNLLALRMTVQGLFIPKELAPPESRARSQNATGSSSSSVAAAATAAARPAIPTLDVDLDAIRAGGGSSS